MYYSKSTNGFYNYQFKKNYGTSWPDDAIQITDELYKELIDGQSAGKIISSDANGLPTLSNPPPLTKEELKKQVLNEKDNLIDLALRQINIIETSIRYADHKSDDDDTPEKRSLTAWVNYFNELKSIEQQPNYPYEINWPEMPIKESASRYK